MSHQTKNYSHEKDNNETKICRSMCQKKKKKKEKKKKERNEEEENKN